MPWKTRMERDIMFNKDIKEAYLQGGKAIGEIGNIHDVEYTNEVIILTCKRCGKKVKK
jgi:hypothetical protein